MAPESPWWLVRKDRLEDAKHALSRLTSDSNLEFDVNKHIALMVATTEHERAVNSSTSYWACFQGTNLRRTIIALGVYCIQTFNGNPLRGYSTYFLQQAGMATTMSFNMTLVGFAVAIVGGFFSVCFPFLKTLPAMFNDGFSGFYFHWPGDGRSTAGALL